MTGIEKKALDQVLKLLESIDTYAVYTDIRSEIGTQEVDADKSNSILRTLQESQSKNMMSKVKEAKSWILTLKEDSNGT